MPVLPAKYSLLSWKSSLATVEASIIASGESWTGPRSGRHTCSDGRFEGHNQGLKSCRLNPKPKTLNPRYYERSPGPGPPSGLHTYNDHTLEGQIQGVEELEELLKVGAAFNLL